MLYIFILVVVVLMTIVGVGLFLYHRSVSNSVASKNASGDITNPGYKMFLDLESSQKKRDEFRRLVPSYVSKDVYKDIPSKQDRDKRFLDDYLYMLDLAIRSYQANPGGVSEVLSRAEYLPVLAWAKFSVDYDKYTRALDAGTFDTRFKSTYGQVPNIDAAMAFLRSVQDMYSTDPRAFNTAIFGDRVTQESRVPSCQSYAPKDRVVYQEVYISKPSTDICLYALQNNAYAGLQKDVLSRRLLADFWMLMRLAVNAYEDGKPSFQAVLAQQKFSPILVFAKFVNVNKAYIDGLPEDMRVAYFSQNADILSKSEALKLVDTFVSRYKTNPEEIDRILYKGCTVGTQQEAPKPAKKDPNSYLVMPAEQRNEAVLYDFLEVFKNAVESIVANKTTLFSLYQSRKSDVEFLQAYEFVPALLYAKFVEDNKEYLNQIDPTLRKQQLTALYPDFTTSERFYVQGIHAQVFLIIASNLYIGSPRDVDIAIYGRSS